MYRWMVKSMYWYLLPCACSEHSKFKQRMLPVGQPVRDLISEWCLMPCLTQTSRILQWTHSSLYYSLRAPMYIRPHHVLPTTVHGWSYSQSEHAMTTNATKSYTPDISFWVSREMVENSSLRRSLEGNRKRRQS